jgi:GntR family transcriptional regulator
LAVDNIVVRQQGRGTFVAEHDQRRALFQFFRIADDDGERRFPETVFSQLFLLEPTAEERVALNLAADARVWRLCRHRALKGQVAMTELISLGADRFPGLDGSVPLPNNVYQLYEQKYGATVTRAEEKLRAVRASSEYAQALGCEEGGPLLQIERRAFGLSGAVIEWRRTRCLTERFHYVSELH